MFFTRSIIDVEGYEFSDFRTLMDSACNFFSVNIFLLFDFRVFCGKTFHIRTPYPKSEFFGYSRRNEFSSLCNKRFILSSYLWPQGHRTRELGTVHHVLVLGYRRQMI